MAAVAMSAESRLLVERRWRMDEYGRAEHYRLEAEKLRHNLMVRHIEHEQRRGEVEVLYIGSWAVGSEQ